jgi:hypothetical protein
MHICALRMRIFPELERAGTEMLASTVPYFLLVLQ